ncbi:c4-dicarboxylate abc transporter [Anaeramoeba ignava]|uniref:C4-dicarboxylate abc transporter n=1 Tax=Anaeramoeba ignava TaxID=1746090 RepID=A0A9Q0LAI3_ANAIG|nr:c4-dicarboxylate abc transporter [Anaeramoeba ignava]
MESTSSDYEYKIEYELQDFSKKNQEKPKEKPQDLEKPQQQQQEKQPEQGKQLEQGKKPTEPKALDVSPTIWKVIFWIVFGQAILIALIYLAKMIRYPEAVIMEFKNKILVNFFPAVNIILLLFSVALIPEHKTTAEAVMWIGASLQLLMSLYSIRLWFTRDFDLNLFNPTAFIPIVAPLFISAPLGQLGYKNLGWFFMSYGLFFWTIMITILFARIIFYKPIDRKFYPAFWIIIAPPAIGLVCYLSLNPPNHWDHFCDFLFYTAVFHFIILLSLTDYIFRCPPCLNYIALTFPLDAIAIAALEYHLHMKNTHTKTFAWITLILASVIVVLVLILIFILIITGRFFVPENKMLQRWWWQSKDKKVEK